MTPDTFVSWDLCKHISIHISIHEYGWTLKNRIEKKRKEYSNNINEVLSR